jgi:hypothetical protein
MPREKDEEVEIRRLAKDTGAIQQPACLFNGRSSQDMLLGPIV